MVLVMDGSAALGLDLSFVTHVFLMEPIWDRRYYIACMWRDLKLPDVRICVGMGLIQKTF